VLLSTIIFFTFLRLTLRKLKNNEEQEQDAIYVFLSKKQEKENIISIFGILVN